MSFDAESHAIYQIANAPMMRFPFPHFYVSPVFPPDYYRELLERLPTPEKYVPIAETGTVSEGAYPERFITELASLEEAEDEAGTGTFWGEMTNWLMGDRFRQAMIDKFRAGIDERFGRGAQFVTDIDARLVRDITNYAIAPHTDSPRKLISLLFYMPADDRLSHLGTSIYAPKKPGFACDGRRHHDFKDFKLAASMPYRPNSLFAFLRTDHSFHGVDKVLDPNVVRNLLLYNIYVQKVARTQPAEDRSWWQRITGRATAQP